MNHPDDSLTYPTGHPAGQSDLMSTAPAPAGTDHTLHHLELLAEKANVQVEKFLRGEVKIHKVVREKTIQVPVTLQEEVLVISYHPAQAHSLPASTVHPDAPHQDAAVSDQDAAVSDHLPATVIQINGEAVQLAAHQSLDLCIYREAAQVVKTAYVVETVQLGKVTHAVEQQVLVQLQHEELVVEEQRVDPPPSSAL